MVDCYRSSKRSVQCSVTEHISEVLEQLVEIFFARGLVKILFATETFAMVRAPARLSLSV